MVVKKRSSNKQILFVKGMIALLHPSETPVTSYTSHHQDLEQQKGKKMVHFGRYHPMTGCNMRFLVPLNCVVLCKQLICFYFSCLPFNKMKCWKK